MRTRSSSNLIVESFIILKRRNHRRSKQIVEPELRTIEEIPVVTMADTRTMSELLQAPIEGYRDDIIIPVILAKKFKLKVELLQLVTSSQFHGFERDDLHSHIRWFNKITSTLKYNNVPHDAIKLMLFLFSLEGQPEFGLKKNLLVLSIHGKISFLNLLRKCLHHGFSKLHQIDTFYNALTQSDQDSLNAAAGGNLLNCTPRDALTIIENKSKELVLMNKDTQQATVKAIEETCVTCGGPHPYYECLAAGGNNFDSQNYNQNRYNQNQGNYQAPNNQGFNQKRADNGPVPTKSTIRVLPLVVQSPPTHSFSELPKWNPYQPLIPYPSRLNKDKLQDKSDIHAHKFLQMSRKLHINISLAEALALMLKYQKMLKELLFDKEKLLGLANTSLTENCSTVLLKKLPEKLRDPGRFLLPCDFHRLESCMALADLGDSINLMPLFVWNKLSLPDLTPTRMTLKLATRSIAYSAGIAKDVFVQVGKFTFPADFVVVDYDVDPRVPLILGRPFLRMACALVDVHEEELILRDGDEKLIFHADSTLKHPHKHGNESINMINFIDITCEDHFPKVLKFKKLNHPSSGSTTSLSDSSPNLIPFETSDSLIEEFTDELALLEPFPPGNEDENFDFEADLRKIEYLLSQNPSTKSEINIIDPVLERFTDEPALNYSPPSGDDDDNNNDLFDLKSDNDEWKQLLYGDCYKDIDSEKDKNKDSEINLLVVEDHIVESNDLLPHLLDNDSTLPEESSKSSEIATLSSSPFENEDKVFNPGILILGRTQIFNDESKDKDYIVNTSSEALLILEEHNFLSISCYQELLFFGINIPYGESKVHIEVLSVLWRNRLPIPDGSLPLS
nr:reverse transcriptase domain-containing protein [Tanacetum cinerariifolium]